MTRTRFDPIRSLVATAAVALLAGTAGCSGGEESAPAGGAPPAAAPATTPAASDTAAAENAEAEAGQIFATRCATCHGPEGKGDGPGSLALDPKPRNFQDPEWQASVNDEHIANIIRYGGAAVGRSPTMPGNPDLASKDAVVEALVEHVRSLGGGSG